MKIRCLCQDKCECASAARISAIVGLIASVIGIVMSMITIIRKKREMTVPKAVKAVSCVCTVFAVAGALLGTLLSREATGDEE